MERWRSLLRQLKEGEEGEEEAGEVAREGEEILPMGMVGPGRCGLRMGRERNQSYI